MKLPRSRLLVILSLLSMWSFICIPMIRPVFAEAPGGTVTEVTTTRPADAVVVHKVEESFTDQLKEIGIALATLVVTVAGAAVTYYVIPWLKRKADEAGSRSEEAGLDVVEKVKGQLKRFLYTTALNMVEQNYPEIVADIEAGKLSDIKAIKQRLYAIGNQLRDRAIAVFLQQGVDLLEILGAEYIDALIRRVSDVTSPFPGKDSAKELLGEGSGRIKKDGVNATRNYYRSLGLDTDSMQSDAVNSAVPNEFKDVDIPT